MIGRCETCGRGKCECVVQDEAEVRQGRLMAEACAELGRCARAAGVTSLAELREREEGAGSDVRLR